MLVVRPISMSDYDSLHECAVESGHGFTSLPVNEELLRKRIQHSEYSFGKGDVSAATDESYLMVGVDSETGHVVGTTGIEAAVGFDTPFYSYHISTHVHSSRRLGVKKQVKILTLGNDYTGATELCTLFLLADYRKGLNGRLLSKCRFLMLAEHQERFDSTVIAEMRGVSDQNGNSPFWQWLKEHFFSIDFTLADYLTGIGNKGFIADLMPKYPIYINLLSEEAQAVIGKVHENTKPALRLLEQEGFSCRDHVDIFDGGPTVECQLAQIRSVRRSIKAKVVIDDRDYQQSVIISNCEFSEFRATATNVDYRAQDGEVYMHSDVAKALLLENGSMARFIINE
jgi:arginine N-succinyltransferase